MRAVFTVEGTGSAIYVLRNGKTVAGPFHGLEMAWLRRDVLERQELHRVRPCLRCGSKFESAGAHNRMRPRCRKSAGEIFTGAV